MNKAIKGVKAVLLSNCILFAGSVLAGEIYVSPDGSDSHAGTVAAPVRTLAAAQKLARVQAGKESVNVILRDGIYYLEAPLVFTSEDSGSKDSPVEYRAEHEGKAVISGGLLLQLQWQEYRDGIYKAAIPQGLVFDQFFVDGVRQITARYPNYDPAQSTVPYNGSAPDAISPQRAQRWSDPKGGYMHAMHVALWGDYHYLITGKDENGKVSYEGGWQNNRQGAPHDRFRFVENIFEELDSPGEWFLDNKTSTVYYYPTEGTELAKAKVEAVVLKHLVEFNGTHAAPVKFVNFDGVKFCHAARTFMDNREPLLRSDWTTYRGGAIFYNGAEDCSITNAVIDQVGGNAVFVNKYNRRITVRDTIISEAGANGVAFVGNPEAVRSPLFEYGQTQPLEKIDRTAGPKTDDYPADCLVDDCLIYRSGRFEKQTAPVQISMSMSVTVSHCSIYDVPRAGINICDGCWGGHTIEYCDVFETVKETGDHGSFNSWGRDRFWLPSISQTSGLVASNPDLPLLDVIKPITIANSRWRCDHGWDIDLDDGSSNYHIYNNLLLNGGLKNREGYYRVVENNILLGEREGTFHPHVWYDNSHDIFRRNIVSVAYKPVNMPGIWGQEIDNNILYSPGVSVAQSADVLRKASAGDMNSLLADVLFTDPAHGNFHVGEGSVALTLGFRNFPMDQFGVTSPKLKALARTPILPELVNGYAGHDSGRDSTVRELLGAKMKNVVGMGEVSAYGLAAESGVILVQIPSGSLAARAALLQSDVVLRCQGQEIKTIDDLSKALSNISKGTKVELTIWRLQQSRTVDFIME